MTITLWGRNRAVLFFLVLAGLWIRGSGSLRPLPEEIAGLWVTNHPRYVGSQIRLTEDEVGFLIHADSNWSFNPVREFRSRSTAVGTRFEIEFVTPEGQEVIDLLFLPEKSQLQFTNQPEVSWYRLLSDK